jgi:hypothetical protein
MLLNQLCIKSSQCMDYTFRYDYKNEINKTGLKV